MTPAPNLKIERCKVCQATMDDCQGKIKTTESIVLLTAHGQNTIEHMYSEALQNKMTSYKTP